MKKYSYIVKHSAPNEFISPDNSGEWKLVAVVHLSTGYNQYFWEREYFYSKEGYPHPPYHGPKFLEKKS